MVSVIDNRAEALFVSRWDASDRPCAALVRDEVWVWSRRLSPAERSGLVAQEFGDHPQAAVERMEWCRRAVREAFAEAPAHA